MNLRKKLKQLYTPNFFKWAIILIISSSCSTNVGQIFKEEPEKKETHEASPEIAPEIAESYKIQEPGSEKKITKKKGSSKKAKHEILPEEIAKLYEPIDKSSEEVWKSFTPYLTNEEEIVMKVAFFGVTVGFMKISVAPMVEIKNTKAYHLIVRLKSADFYSFIYSLDNVVESFIDEKKIIPLKYILVQRESKQRVDDFQIFDSEKRQTFSWYKREKLSTGEIQKKDESGYLTKYFQDSLSALFFTRGLKFEPGKVIEFPLVNKGKTLIVKLKVLGIEDLKVMGKFQKAYKIEASSYPIQGEKKDEYVLFWYSQDPEQRLLKFSAKVKFGNVSGEIVEYKRGAPLKID
jgi:hypothetical protein